jgi:hypothetical protein
MSTTTVTMEYNKRTGVVKFFGQEAFGFDSLSKYLSLTQKQIAVIQFLANAGKIDSLVANGASISCPVDNDDEIAVKCATKIKSEKDRALAHDENIPIELLKKYPNKREKLEQMHVPTLKQMCKEAQIPRFSKMRKEGLINALMTWLE